MKKILIAGLLILILMLGACSVLTGSNEATEDDVEQTKTVETINGEFSITVPDSWIKDYGMTEEEMLENFKVLAYTDNDTSFIDMFLYEYSLNDSLKLTLDYYSDNLIGEYEETTIDGMDGFVFEYSMVDKSIDEYEFNYHGYFYMINTPYGVAEIDIYYVQEVFESKIIKPSDEQLKLLREIAESFKVVEEE